MIEMMRVDDRLIHGQVALLWTKQLGLNRIIVANDKAAKSEIQKNALLLAAPAGVKVAVVEVDKAIKMANDPRGKNFKMLLLVNNVDDLYTIVKGVEPGSTKVDIANVGRVSGDIENKHKLTETVYLSDDEVTKANEINDLAKNFVYQPLPTDEPKPFESLLKGVH
ncbi:PTS system mannose/fructose/N-acetylgalactosamine-transporter subunit IIB [Schleiferilactobacillus shenzhenensis]|nr:PTS sugar transporter subunit IIB [Schleiferilactobacillus shenzhenensis]